MFQFEVQVSSSPFLRTKPGTQFCSSPCTARDTSPRPSCLTQWQRDSRPVCSLTVCEHRRGLKSHRVINDGKGTGLVFTDDSQRGAMFTQTGQVPRVLALCHRCILQLVVTLRAETDI